MNDTANTLLPTTLVGSYSQPNWLIDRDKLGGRLPPRTRALELWRVDPEQLIEAQNDATLIAIREQEIAGLDIITDGETRRESYSNRFATALDGVDLNNPGTAMDRTGKPNPVPRITGPIRRKHPVEVEDVKFLRAHTDRRIKMTIPGPFTMSQQAQNDFYDDEVEMALDYAAAVNEEAQDLFAAGADIVQIDEPYMQARPDTAREYGLEALNRALDGLIGETAVHICFGYAATSTIGQRAIPSCPNSRTVPCRVFLSRRPNQVLIVKYWKLCQTKKSFSVCSIFRRIRWKPRKLSRTIFAVHCPIALPNESSLRPTVGSNICPGRLPSVK